MKLNFLQVYTSLVETGGATYNYNIPELNPTAGFVVALQGHEKTYPIPANVNRFQDVVTDYLNAEVTAILQDSRNYFLGFWIEKDLLYVDIVEVIDDQLEAIQAGIERKQLAIYDNAKKESIYL